MTTRCSGVTSWPRAPTIALGVQEQHDLVAQPRELVVGVDREERERLERLAPQRIGNRRRRSTRCSRQSRDRAPNIGRVADCARIRRRLEIERRRVRIGIGVDNDRASVARRTAASASVSGSASTSRSSRSMARSRTARLAIVLLACSSFFLVWRAPRRTCANSVLTAPSSPPHLARPLLDGQRAKSHLQAVEQREEIASARRA